MAHSSYMKCQMFFETSSTGCNILSHSDPSMSRDKNEPDRPGDPRRVSGKWDLT
jgi:hypothetical protein